MSSHNNIIPEVGSTQTSNVLQLSPVTWGHWIIDLWIFSFAYRMYLQISGSLIRVNFSCGMCDWVLSTLTVLLSDLLIYINWSLMSATNFVWINLYDWCSVFYSTAHNIQTINVPPWPIKLWKLTVLFVRCFWIENLRCLLQLWLVLKKKSALRVCNSE